MITVSKVLRMRTAARLAAPRGYRWLNARFYEAARSGRAATSNLRHGAVLIGAPRGKFIFAVRPPPASRRTAGRCLLSLRVTEAVSRLLLNRPAWFGRGSISRSRDVFISPYTIRNIKCRKNVELKQLRTASIVSSGCVLFLVNIGVR